MSTIVEFPHTAAPRRVDVVWTVRAYRKADFSLLERAFDNERDANGQARAWYDQGFDITVRRHLIEHIADWAYDEDWSKDD